jgi:hypothetical protein
MKIKLLKTGKVALHPAFGPIYDATKDEHTSELTDLQCEFLIENEWAKEVKSKNTDTPVKEKKVEKKDEKKVEKVVEDKKKEPTSKLSNFFKKKE